MNVAFPKATYLIFVVVPILLLFWYLLLYQRRSLKNFAEKKSLRKLYQGHSEGRFWLHVVLLCFVWIAGTVALMQPRGIQEHNAENSDEIINENIIEEKDVDDQEPIIKRRKVHDVIFLLDASASMSVSDTKHGRSRLDYAKDIIDEIIGRLNGETVAIYAFTSEATSVVPLTGDYLYSRLLLKNVGINEGDVAGTDLMEALETIKHRHLRTSKQKLTTLILLTDGGDTRLETLSGDQYEREFKTLANCLDNAENLRIFTVGLGSHEGDVIPDVAFEGQTVRSSLDEKLLKDLSKCGNYYFANEYNAMTISNDVINIMSQDVPFEEDVEITPQSEAFVERTIKNKDEQNYTLYYQIPLAIAIILLTINLWFRK